MHSCVSSMESKYTGKFYFQKRYLVAILAFFGWIFMYLLRTNLSISIVHMTSNRSVTNRNESIVEVAEFDWSPQLKGVILSAFSWGYFAAPLGAPFARKLGSVTVFGIGVLLTSLLTFITPFIMRWNLYVFLVTRIFEGIFESVSATSFVEILRIWSLPSERSRFSAFAIAGCGFGSMLGFPICGTIAYHMDWQAIFYITGGVSLIWSLIWFTFIRNNPEEDNMMSVCEKRRLKQFNQSTNKKTAVPWKQILTSKGVWAYWNSRFAQAWSLAFLTYCIPIYIKDVYNVNIQTIGFLSGLPHFCGIIGIIGGSILADFLKNHDLLSVTKVYKLYLSFIQFLAIGLLITASLKINFVVIIICFISFQLLFGATTVTYGVLPIDMAGEHACLISGLGSTMAAFAFSLSTLCMGLIVTHHSADEWCIYFLMLSLLNLWGGIIFYVFGTGELQPWATPTEIDQVN